MRNKIINSVDFFLHPSLKNNSEKLAKSRMMVIMLLSFTLVLFFYVMFYVFNGEISTPKAFYNYLGFSFLALSVFIIKKSGKVNVVLIMVNLLGYFLITQSVYLSGGIYSHDLVWYIILMGGGFIFISISYGIVISFLSISALLMFYLLESLHLYSFPQNIVSQSISYKFVNLIFVLLIISFLIFTLVRGNKALQKTLRKERENEFREGIARDFHDQIGNKLASINQLSFLLRSEDELNEDIVKKIESNTKSVYENFKDFIWYQNPQSDYLSELYMYIKDYTEDFLEFSGINFYISLDSSTEEEIKLPPFYSKEIVAIFKEFITNSYKHANASNLFILVKIVNNEIVIACNDDGVGYNKSSLKRENGIKNIYHRANKLGIDIELNSLEENFKGTQLILKIKLPV